MAPLAVLNTAKLTLLLKDFIKVLFYLLLFPCYASTTGLKVLCSICLLQSECDSSWGRLFPPLFPCVHGRNHHLLCDLCIPFPHPLVGQKAVLASLNYGFVAAWQIMCSPQPLFPVTASIRLLLSSVVIPLVPDQPPVSQLRALHPLYFPIN